MERVIQFLKEVRVELSKVTWPSRRQLAIYTGVVLGLSLFVAIYLGSLNALFSWIINRLVGA